ncbi:MAG TPA: hypothetical protein VEZ11_12385 [Thermoanaerobaculia bacterium]|nr:hypothetical protein [Thermoanaerobaculia bacterium]
MKKQSPPAADSEEKPARNTQPVRIWLTPAQIAWLKPKGPSETIRALLTEAVSMENLAKSLKEKQKGKKK